ncbi:DMT family transporter [Sphingopyxis yananensis]|uniref:DMT family transporter n=1 Tax=Sphingopyxis yananensis TaxID=2886687 RepID=UPI001D122ADF|nr:SMR family transporter [Sphingopyxis yananensis]MCC2601879.1 QacE family quaternary ammonium compound efflux SMR transporter [Sphingopyxis yananensis]
MERDVNYLYLAIAIVSEVIATSFMKESNGFTKLVPSLVTVIGYGVAFYCLSLTLRTIPTGIAYAIWSGLGIVLISGIAWLFQGQKLDVATMIGMGLIVSGVIVMNLFSTSLAH